MGNLLQASIKLRCRTNETIRSLSAYAEEGYVSETVAFKLQSAGWTTDYQVYANLVAFSILTETERVELRTALGIEERELKRLGDFLRW